MEDRKQNNSAWIVDEFTEWIDKAVAETHKLANTATKAENARLYEKECTLRMVKTKFEQLKYD